MTRLLVLPHAYPRPTKHLEPYARNNDPDVTARWCAEHPKRPGNHPATDMDGQALVSEAANGQRRIIFIHWPKVERNGFTHKFEHGHLHRLTRRERRSYLESWTLEDALNLRAPDGRGGWWAPSTPAMVAEAHAQHGVLMIIEAKPGAHMGNRSAWRAAKADCDAVGCDVAMKAMPLPGWRRAMRAARAEGVPGAVIGGGKRRRMPLDLRLRRQPAWINAVWAQGWRFRR